MVLHAGLGIRKGHRAHFIENGEVSDMKEILIKVLGLMKMIS